MKNKICKILTLVFFIFSILYGDDALTVDNSILYDMPRQRALGGSDILFARDGMPSSNPAAISLDSLSKISIGYIGFYQNSFTASGVSFVSTVNNSIGYGISASYLYIPNIENTQSLEHDSLENLIAFDKSKIKYENASEFNFNASLSYTVLKKKFINFSVGGALHGMRRRLINWTGYGIGFDLAVISEFPKAGVRLSLVGDDITTNYISWSESYHENGLPRLYGGIGYSKDIPYIYGAIKVTYHTPDLFSNSGAYYSNIGSQSEPGEGRIRKNPILLITAASYGVEYVIYKIVSLQVGLDDVNRFNFGAGVNLFKQSLAFNFSYTPSYDLFGTYALSASYNW